MKKVIIALFLGASLVCNANGNAQYPELYKSHFIAAGYNFATKNFDLAEDNARYAIAIAESLNDSMLIAESYGRFGMLLYDMGKIIGANRNLSRSIRTFTSAGVKSKYFIPILENFLMVQQKSGTILETANNTYNVSEVFFDELSKCPDSSIHNTYRNGRLSVLQNNDTLSMARYMALYAIRLSRNMDLMDTPSLVHAGRTIDSAIYLFYKNTNNSVETYPLEYQQMKIYNKLGASPSTNLYGGIEIGSKGVKLSVTYVTTDPDGNYNYEIRFDTTINTDFISFTQQSFNNTLEAFGELRNLLINKFQISDADQYFAFSGGVVSQAERKQRKYEIARMQDSIRSLIGNPNKEITPLNPCEESRLSHLGIISKKNRFISTLLDIGSGNSKGGYFPDESGKFVCYNIEYGSKALGDLIRSDTIARFHKILLDSIALIKRNTIKPVLDAVSPIRNRANIVISGGVSWAIATIMKPESFSRAFVQISKDEILKFKTLLMNNYDELVSSPGNFLTKLSLENDRIKLKKQFKRIFDTFDQKTLLAGTELLTAILDNLSTGVKKEIYFARYAQVGWITGFIIKKLDEGNNNGN